MTDLWFVTWRCGGSFLTADRAAATATCPEHPEAEALGPAEPIFDVDLPADPIAQALGVHLPDADPALGLHHDPVTCPAHGCYAKLRRETNPTPSMRAAGVWFTHPETRHRSLVGHTASACVPAEVVAEWQRLGVNV